MPLLLVDIFNSVFLQAWDEISENFSNTYDMLRFEPNCGIIQYFSLNVSLNPAFVKRARRSGRNHLRRRAAVVVVAVVTALSSARSVSLPKLPRFVAGFPLYFGRQGVLTLRLLRQA